eukprot:1195000-Prorocentrum_minimum.AAC.1
MLYFYTWRMCNTSVYMSPIYIRIGVVRLNASESDQDTIPENGEKDRKGKGPAQRERKIKEAKAPENGNRKKSERETLPGNWLHVRDAGVLRDQRRVAKVIPALHVHRHHPRGGAIPGQQLRSQVLPRARQVQQDVVRHHRHRRSDGGERARLHRDPQRRPGQRDLARAHVRPREQRLDLVLGGVPGGDPPHLHGVRARGFAEHEQRDLAVFVLLELDLHHAHAVRVLLRLVPPHRRPHQVAHVARLGAHPLQLVAEPVPQGHLEASERAVIVTPSLR